MNAKPTTPVARADFVKQPAHLPDRRLINYYWFTLPPLKDPEHPQPVADPTEAAPANAGTGA